MGASISPATALTVAGRIGQFCYDRGLERRFADHSQRFRADRMGEAHHTGVKQ
jgi:hypothetical protein